MCIHHRFFWPLVLLFFPLILEARGAHEPKPPKTEPANIPASIERLVIQDFPSWNSSHERQLEREKDFIPTQTLTDEDPEFKKLAASVFAQAKINGSMSFPEFFQRLEQIERRLDETPRGYSPARTVIKLGFSSGGVFEVGEHPLYSVTELDGLIQLTRKKGRRRSYDIKNGTYHDENPLRAPRQPPLDRR